ncbi:MAG: acyl-CoA dehydrogenase family protein [Rubrivivax sp.]|nr:acyl-CoA dehydrogenase family protein [Rubrivivax sp.]
MSVLNAEEQSALAAARDFADTQVRPRAAAWAHGAADARALLVPAAQAGLLGLEVPVAQGGRGLSFACKWQVAETLAAVDFGFAMSLINTHNVARHLALSATPAVAQRFVPELLAGRRTGCTALTEPGAGSDFAAITTTARRDVDGWLLDGRKAWIVNATHAEVLVVYAQTEPGSGARGIAAFVVDGTREGFVRDAGAPGATSSAAARAIDVGGFQLQGYRAHEGELLHAPGQAFKAALASINGARVYVAAMCCGMVAECLRVAADYGARRHAFGQPLHGHQGWRWALADAAIDLEAARRLVEAAGDGIAAGPGNAATQTAAAQAKVFATRMAGRHVAALLHAMGAEGLRDEHPFLRHLGAAQVAALVDGSTEMLLERIAKDLRPRSAPSRA